MKKNPQITYFLKSKTYYFFLIFNGTLTSLLVALIVSAYNTMLHNLK